MALTLRTAIDRTLFRLSLAGGVDTQTYSEDVLKEIIQNKVTVLFDKYWWPAYYNPGEVFSLDGTTGMVTGDISAKIKRFMDIRYIWLGDSDSPLPRAPYRVNPSRIKQRSFLPVADATKVFKVFPSDSTDDVTVAYRTLPLPIEEDDDQILIDDELIILGSAYDYANGLGLNPGEEAKLAAMFEDRLQTLISTLDSHEIPLGSSSESNVLTDWYEH